MQCIEAFRMGRSISEYYDEPVVKIERGMQARWAPFEDSPFQYRWKTR